MESSDSAPAERQVDAAQCPLVEMEGVPEDHAIDEHAGQDIRDVHVRHGKPGSDAGAQSYVQTHAETIQGTLIVGSSRGVSIGETRIPF